jgi:hypothetical protein
MLDMEFDQKLGILRCISSGFTPIEEVEAFGRKAVLLQDVARARLGCCLILVDASDTGVQTQEAMGRMSELAATRRKPGDRTAIVIGSALAKMQSQRTASKEETGYFATEAEALAWLLAQASGTKA